MKTMDPVAFREMLKTELPRMLREYPESRYEFWGIMVESFPSRQEFATMLDELRAFREDSNRRFEEINRRFEAADRRFESLESRTGAGFEAAREERQALEGRMEAGFQAVRQEMETGFEVAREERQALEGRMDAGFQAVRQEMSAGFQAARRDLDRLGSRWGIRNESLFRQTIAALLEKSFGAQVESRFINGEEFDVIISDGAHILIEITASAGPKTQERLERKRELYTEATGVVPARVVLATASIHSRRAQALRDAGFEVIEPEEEAME